MLRVMWIRWGQRGRRVGRSGSGDRPGWARVGGLVAAALLLAGGARAAGRIPLPLLERAASGEPVRVIVELDEGWAPEGWLPGPVERQAQRARIAGAAARLTRALTGSDADRIRPYEVVPFVALRAGTRALAVLESAPGVVAVREDRPALPVLDRTVPLIGGTAAAAIGFDGSGQTVVVLDTGVDGNHQNFTGKIVDEACFADGASGPPSQGDCPNGGNTQFGVGAGVPCNYSDECLHGTHVAGIAAGSGPAYSGVAPGADLIPIQVFSEFPAYSCDGVSPCPKSWSSDQDLALQYVYQTLRLGHDIAAVNMSLGEGSYTDPATCDATRPSTKALIDQLRSVDIATVVASGNYGCGSAGCTNAIAMPACISSAVSVGATRVDQEFAPTFGNTASFLSLFAPGQGIVAPLYQTVDQYTRQTGTSMAAPHVAGAWAITRQAVPGVTVSDALSAFQSTGVVVSNGQGVRRIQVDAALVALGVTDCSDGVDNDGDGLVNLDDPGCDSASDTSEQSAALPCDNGVDDDGDGAIDLADLGCRDPGWSTENPQCQDGVDNDGDGGVDWDGNPPDTRCWAPHVLFESKCGLGAELALLLIPVGLWRSRRRRR